MTTKPKKINLTRSSRRREILRTKIISLMGTTEVKSRSRARESFEILSRE